MHDFSSMGFVLELRGVRTNQLNWLTHAGTRKCWGVTSNQTARGARKRSVNDFWTGNCQSHSDGSVSGLVRGGFPCYNVIC